MKNNTNFYYKFRFEYEDVTAENIDNMLQNAKDAVNVLTSFKESFTGKQKSDEKAMKELAKKSDQQSVGFMTVRT